MERDRTQPRRGGMRKSGTECRERKQKVGESRFGTAPSFCAFVTDTHSSGVNTWRTWRTNIRTCSFIAYSVPKSARILSPAELLPKLWRYFAGIGRNHRIPVLAAGGIPNHVHLLIVLPSDVSVAKAAQILKANASTLDPPTWDRVRLARRIWSFQRKQFKQSGRHGLYRAS